MSSEMIVSLVACTPNPEIIIATAAKLCYSKLPADKLNETITLEEARNFINKLSDMGHATPTEMADFVFSVDGVSRACSHQLVRHRLMSVNQKSQRYVSENNFSDSVVVPKDIQDHPVSLEIFNNLMYEIQDGYVKIKEDLMQDGYNEKKAQEVARSVLPNATSSNLIIKMNARELMHFFSVRCCNRAQDEIRELADKMLDLCKEQAPALFKKAGSPCMIDGTCPEGVMSCGNPRN